MSNHSRHEHAMKMVVTLATASPRGPLPSRPPPQAGRMIRSAADQGAVDRRHAEHVGLVAAETRPRLAASTRHQYRQFAHGRSPY